MAMKRGARYRCPNSGCGCEVLVTKGTSDGIDVPTCGCGTEMEQR
jgi:hypothetical protein